VAGGVGGEGQVIRFGGVAEMVEYDSGLDAGDAARGIDLENLSHVPGEIEDDGDVAALSGERGSATATEQRSAEVPADGDGGFNIIGIAWENYADWDLAVIGAVSGVEGAATVVETDIPADVSSQGFVQPQGIGHGGG